VESHHRIGYAIVHFLRALRQAQQSEARSGRAYLRTFPMWWIACPIASVRAGVPLHEQALSVGLTMTSQARLVMSRRTILSGVRHLPKTFSGHGTQREFSSLSRVRSLLRQSPPVPRPPWQEHPSVPPRPFWQGAGSYRTWSETSHTGDLPQDSADQNDGRRDQNIQVFRHGVVLLHSCDAIVTLFQENNNRVSRILRGLDIWEKQVY